MKTQAKKTVHLSFRTEAETGKKAEDEARSLGMSLGEYARYAFERYVKDAERKQLAFELSELKETVHLVLYRLEQFMEALNINLEKPLSGDRADVQHRRAR